MFWVPFESYKSRGICSFALKFGQKLVWHINNKNLSANFLNPNIFTPRVKDVLQLFTEIKYGKSQTRFLALSVRKLGDKLNMREKKKSL